MTTADHIYDEAKTLPESLAQEVLDFIEFLKTRSDRLRATDLMRAQEESLAAVWDNAEDDVWNDA
jgi:hypothetical protein